MFALTLKNIEDIRNHTLSEFPKEACGMIVEGDYMPCINYAADPERDFEIAAAAHMGVRAKGLKINAIVHSHPNGPLFPTASDMRGQLSTDLPWVLVSTDGERVSTPEVWGGDTPIPPVIGRQFMHGIRDCYSLVRDVFRLGAEELAKQDVKWPFKPAEFPDFARDDGWWGEPRKPGQNLYVDNFESVGWKAIPREDVRPGDAFLCKINSDNLNHSGLLLDENLILHHLPTRLSRREPAGAWARAAELWVRYQGAELA